ncbi:polysaccharide lyase [Duganella violaceipulchra]|uniref:Polysaccharide lyase n=1 Tax=Duganella violaceipulchra TaxID=2849652 RepID=A0AA41H4W2_9BURK|nr:polysaccharide lyase [Duganella violaceicalia]MBV6319949.1 polysaccharide lyase [Duganella violaceicalia]MCP2010313.1 hypothetical protein [Duganella violaceicalia]
MAQVDLGRAGLVTTMAPSTVVVPSISALLTYNSTATVRYFGDLYSLNAGLTDAVKLVPDPSGKSRNVFKMSRLQSDPLWSSTARTEVAARNEYIIQGVRWYGISVYFPTDWLFNPAPTVVAQLHTSQKTLAVSPPVSIVASGANMSLELNYNHRALDGTDPATKANSALKSIRLGSIQTAKWYCFVVRADWNNNAGAGNFSLWMNGDNVYTASNQTNDYSTWLGNYPKTGIYMPGSMTVPYRNIYTDFIWLGGPSTTFAQMYAQTPCGS